MTNPYTVFGPVLLVFVLVLVQSLFFSGSFAKAEWDADIFSKIGGGGGDIVTDQDVAKFLDEQQRQTNEFRELGEQQQQQRLQLLQRCGNRNACATGFECTSTRASFILGNRCIAKSCLEEQLTALPQEVEIEQYMELMYQKAQLTRDDLINAYHNASSSSSQQEESQEDQYHRGPRQRFVETAEFQSLWNTMEANPELRNKMAEIFKTCMVEPAEAAAAVVSKGDDGGLGLDDQRQASIQGNTFYYGLHVELGAGFDGAFMYFEAAKFADVGSTKRSFFMKVSGGCSIGVGFETLPIFGYAQTGFPDDMESCSYIADADIGTLIGGGVALGAQFNNIFLAEVTLGPISWTFELAGSSLCQAFKTGERA